MFIIGGLVVIAIAFHIFVFHQYNYPWTTRIINKIPGPEGIFYLGSSMQFWNTKSEDRIEYICDLFKKYGSTYRVWFSGVPTVFISKIDDYQTVLGSRLNSTKGIMYRHILPWLGRGLLTSSGKKWHSHRKIITPTFHFSILRGFVDIFNRNTDVLVKKLLDVAGEKEVDLAMYVTPCTLDNVCETAMGTRINAQSGEPHNYASAVFQMGSIIAERIFSPLLFPDVNFALSAMGRQHNQLLQQLHAFTQEVITEAKTTRNELNTAVELDDRESGLTDIYCNRLTFLKLLLEKQNEHGLSDQDIREEVDTFMFEGHDTTSMGIIWTLFELGCNHDIQLKCYEELEGIFGSSKRMSTYEDIMQMNYLKQVVQESLRLHPSVPIISRKFPVDMQLSDYVVPAGTEIIMCLYHLHRNPEVYPNPSEFNPDRFLPKNIETRHRYAYLPFSAGLRNCVGQRFAMLELLIVISSIIRQFKIETMNDRSSVKSVPEMTLRPATQILWKITVRDGCNQS